MFINVLAGIYSIPMVATFFLYMKIFHNINKAIKLGLTYKQKQDDEFEAMGFGVDAEETIKMKPALREDEEAIKKDSGPKKVEEAIEMKPDSVPSKPEEQKENRNKNLKDLLVALSLSKGLFISFSILALTITLFFVVSVFDFEKVWPTSLHLYAILFFRLCAAVNPIIYPLFHSSFWKGYKNVFRKFYNFITQKIQQFRLFCAKQLNSCLLK